MRIKDYKQMMSYLTRPDPLTPKERAIKNKQNDLKEQNRLLQKRKEYEVDTSSLEMKIQQLEKELSEETMTKKTNPLDNIIPELTKQTILHDGADPRDHEAFYDPNSGLFTNKVKTASFRNAVDAVKWNKTINPNAYPKEASPQQMAELKGKMDKYKYIHGDKQKPFKKPELKDKPVRKPGAVPPKTNTVKMDSIPIPKFDPNLYNRAIEINNERPEQPINVPAPNLPFEETAEAKGTIFETDAYYRRKRGL